MPEVSCEWFRLDEVQDLPAGPGLYGWYIVPVAGPNDWASSTHLGSFLSQHTRSLSHPNLVLEVNWHLGAMWDGELVDSGNLMLADQISRLASGESTSPGLDLHKTLNSAVHRPLLAEVLLKSAPRLSPPVYVGISKGLRGRLLEHRGHYEKARQALADGEDPLQVVGNKLGTRLALKEVPPEALRITAFEISGLGHLTEVEWRRLAAAAEFVLNRWSHPLFGER